MKSTPLHDFYNFEMINSLHASQFQLNQFRKTINVFYLRFEIIFVMFYTFVTMFNMQLEHN